MKISIYQINLERDNDGLAFQGTDYLNSLGRTSPDSSSYDLVWTGDVHLSEPEDIYKKFNLDIPDNYAGRPMSVSDVLEISDGEYKGFWYCDNIGFQGIDFDKESVQQSKQDKIRVVMVNPGEVAKIQYISADLTNMQKIVGGYIECYYPYEDNTCIICNDSGKIDQLAPNRAVYDNDGEIVDIIFGPFFVCDASTENFKSLSKEQANQYVDKFKLPELFYMSKGNVKAETYKPEEHEKNIREER